MRQLNEFGKFGELEKIGELGTEVVGYIIAYWECCSDGHNYLAINHAGQTTRDMAYQYMTERYEDYLADIDSEYYDGYRALLISQSPTPVPADATPLEQAMAAFDAMFAYLWPEG